MHRVGQNRGRVCMGVIKDKGFLHRLTVFFGLRYFCIQCGLQKCSSSYILVHDNQTNEI